MLFRYKAILEREHEALAASVSRENGKLLDDARNEVRRGIEVVDFACGMPTLAQGRTVEGIARGIDSHTWRVPVGVVAGICPFNFPAMIPLWMFPIAIAAGNTFVLKPSERDPVDRPAPRRAAVRPASRPACSTSCTARARRWTASSITRASGRLVHRFHGGGAAGLRAGEPRTGSGARR